MFMPYVYIDGCNSAVPMEVYVSTQSGLIRVCALASSSVKQTKAHQQQLKHDLILFV